jgi:hypothetical protein
VFFKSCSEANSVRDTLALVQSRPLPRLLAYNFQIHIGLVTFGTKAAVSQGITNAIENFRHKLNSIPLWEDENDDDVAMIWSVCRRA